MRRVGSTSDHITSSRGAKQMPAFPPATEREDLEAAAASGASLTNSRCGRRRRQQQQSPRHKILTHRRAVDSGGQQRNGNMAQNRFHARHQHLDEKQQDRYSEHTMRRSVRGGPLPPPLRQGEGQTSYASSSSWASSAPYAPPSQGLATPPPATRVPFVSIGVTLRDTLERQRLQGDRRREKRQKREQRLLEASTQEQKQACLQPGQARRNQRPGPHKQRCLQQTPSSYSSLEFERIKHRGKLHRKRQTGSSSDKDRMHVRIAQLSSMQRETVFQENRLKAARHRK